MRERDRLTAERFGIFDRVEALEQALLQIDRVVGVEFDLDGFYSDIFQVIVVPEYDIPVTTPDYFDVRQKMLHEVLSVTREHGLMPSGDSIEDYGKHYYIVRNCDKSWKELVEQYKVSVDDRLASAVERSVQQAGGNSTRSLDEMEMN